MRNVLIIGGSRFLGRAITESFLEEGSSKIWVMNRGSRDNLPGIAGSYQCDKKEREDFKKVLLDRPWDTIIDTILDDEDLKWVVETLGRNVGHFIHTGSIGVYGDARRIPAPEWLPMQESESEEVGGEVEERIFNYKIRPSRGTSPLP